MPEDQYLEATKRKRKSLNQFILEAVEEKLVRERQAEYAAGFANLAGSVDDESRAWLETQREAMRRIDD